MNGAFVTRGSRTGTTQDYPSVLARLKALPKRTFHHRDQLREWGVEPPAEAGEWFAFVSVDEAEAAAKLAEVAE